MEKLTKDQTENRTESMEKLTKDQITGELQALEPATEKAARDLDASCPKCRLDDVFENLIVKLTKKSTKDQIAFAD